MAILKWRSKRPLFSTPLGLGVTHVGRCPYTADIALFGDDTLSRRHCQLHQVAPGTWAVTDHSRHGTKLGDTQLRRGQPAILANGDVLTIGSFQAVYLTHAMPTSVATAPAPQTEGLAFRYEVEVVAGPLPKVRLLVPSGTATLGQGPQAFAVPGVPDVQGEIKFVGFGAVYIPIAGKVDLADCTGQRHRLTGPTPLTEGDVLWVGSTGLRVLTRARTRPTSRLGNLVAQSREYKQVLGELEHLSTQDAPLLFEGPQGTGKSLAAAQLHLRQRFGQPLHEVAAERLVSLPLLAEALQTAEGGTLVISDIEQLPPVMNRPMTDLLAMGHVVHHGYPVGSDVQVIATTQVTLRKKLAKREFSQTLYQQLQAQHLVWPTLAARPLDTSAIANEILRQWPHGIALTQLAHDKLRQYDWPGNSRELLNRLRWACATPSLRSGGLLGAAELALPKPAGVLDRERAAIRACAALTNSTRAAAAMLGKHRYELIQRMQELGMEDA